MARSGDGGAGHRGMPGDALREMVAAYKELGKEIPPGNALIEQLAVEVGNVGQSA